MKRTREGSCSLLRVSFSTILQSVSVISFCARKILNIFRTLSARPALWRGSKRKCIRIVKDKKKKKKKGKIIKCNEIVAGRKYANFYFAVNTVVPWFTFKTRVHASVFHSRFQFAIPAERDFLRDFNLSTETFKIGLD